MHNSNNLNFSLFSKIQNRENNSCLKAFLYLFEDLFARNEFNLTGFDLLYPLLSD